MSVAIDDVGDMLELDGSHGEGGGQLLRTALVAASVTGTPFRITRIRAGRDRPGLRPQHLAAVRAAAGICDAEVHGAEPGAGELVFSPRGLVAGDFSVEIGTAGSACLVVQMLCVPLLSAPGPATVSVTGGTHTRSAPPAEFLQRAFLPLLDLTGGHTTLRLRRHGFEPAGGGRLVLRTEPATARARIELTDAGPVRRTAARALLSDLPRHVGERELGIVADELGWAGRDLTVEEVTADSPGNALLVTIEHEVTTAVFCSLGRPGLPAERVAHRAVERVRHHLEADVPVGAHLADQLLVPLALGAGGVFRTVPPTSHLTTNIHTIRQFTDTPIEVTAASDGAVIVEVAGWTDGA